MSKREANIEFFCKVHRNTLLMALKSTFCSIEKFSLKRPDYLGNTHRNQHSHVRFFKLSQSGLFLYETLKQILQQTNVKNYISPYGAALGFEPTTARMSLLPRPLD